VNKTAFLAAAAITLVPAAAIAQSAPAPAPQPAASATTVQGVTVTVDPNAFRSSADSKSYDLTKDLQATAGSVADALRNIPSVDVDLNGNVSIRGDGNVQILVDGQPASQFKGQGAGLALTSAPADQYERVEVMTNPSVAYSPEGAGGIINLITKKHRKAGLSGSMRATVGTRGRWGVGGNVAYKGDRVSVSAGADYRTDPQHEVDDDRRTTYDPAGAITGSSDLFTVIPASFSHWALHGAVDFSLDAHTQLSAEAHYNSAAYDATRQVTLDTFDAYGARVSAFAGGGYSHNQRRTPGASTTFRHDFAREGETFTAVLSQDRTTYGDQTLLPTPPADFDLLHYADTNTVTDFKGDYVRPMPGHATLKAGYDLQTESFNDTTAGFLNASSPSSPFQPGQADRYHARREVDALYATWEQPIGAVTVLAGLRGERAHVSLNDAVSAITSDTTGFRLYPSVNVTWRLDDAQQLSASYSQRVQRVPLDELDPFVIFESANTAYTGNPTLRDQETQVFEAGYQYKAGGAYYLATLYYKDNERGPTPVSTLLPDGVLLQIPESLARSTAYGLELTANGQIAKSLTYNVSANWYQTRFDATPLGGLGERQGDTLSGRGSLNWQATDNDLFQISARASGRQVTVQGFKELGPLINLGYRHKVSDQLSVFVTAQDAFATYRFEEVQDAALFRDVMHNRGRIQAAFIGFTYAFGAGAKKEPGFDYSN
jgi:outer membrane receptor protein involved in Fe transport